MIATELTARANPDGYTLFLASATHAINPLLLCVASPGLDASNLKELIAIARSKPGRINYATSGPGTGGDLTVDLIKYNAGIDMQQLAVLGSAPREARRFTQAEIDRWTNLIRKANISAQ